MEENDIAERFRTFGIDQRLIRSMIYLHKEFNKGINYKDIDKQLLIENTVKFSTIEYSQQQLVDVISLAFDSWKFLKKNGGDISKFLMQKEDIKPISFEFDYNSPTIIASRYLQEQFRTGKKPEDIDISELSDILGDTLKEKREFSLIDSLLVRGWSAYKSSNPDMAKYPDIEELRWTFPFLEENLISRKVIELQEKLIAEGKDVQIFDSLDEVLLSITESKEVEGLNIYRRMLESETFRFICRDHPEISVRASDALAKSIAETAALSTQKARDARTKNADDYAKEMYETINRLKREQKISTFRATVDMLNKEDIPTPKGGKWHIKSLQSLNKRWQDLGLRIDPE